MIDDNPTSAFNPNNKVLYAFKELNNKNDIDPFMVTSLI